MAHQGELFSRFGRDHAAQRSLFDDGPRLSGLSCSECGEPMEETPSGFITCPAGHGRLNVEAPAAFDQDSNGSWFDE